eukprot:1615174-Pyramimonas_sp.AAC.1
MCTHYRCARVYESTHLWYKLRQSIDAVQLNAASDAGYGLRSGWYCNVSAYSVPLARRDVHVRYVRGPNCNLRHRQVAIGASSSQPIHRAPSSRHHHHVIGMPSSSRHRRHEVINASWITSSSSRPSNCHAVI